MVRICRRLDRLDSVGATNSQIMPRPAAPRALDKRGAGGPQKRLFLPQQPALACEGGMRRCRVPWPDYACWNSPASWRGPGPGRFSPISAPTSSRSSAKAPATTPAAGARPSSKATDGGHLGAAYFHATNRGKRSIELDFESEDGRRIVSKLAARSDVLIENFKVGGLAKFGLDYASLRKEYPRLIYCSVTGFGQDGPYAARAGYDLMAQGMGGIMDLTGAPDGEPPARRGSGRRYLHRRSIRSSASSPRSPSASGPAAAALSIPRWSTARSACSPTRRSIISSPARSPSASATRIPTSCPTRFFRSPMATSSSPPATTASSPSSAQCWASPKLAEEPNYRVNSDRLKHRDELVARLSALTRRWSRADLLAKLEAVQVPAGPINPLDQVFADPQVMHRGMRIDRAERRGQGRHHPRRAHADHDRRQADGGGAPRARGSASNGGDFARDRRGLTLSSAASEPSHLCGAAPIRWSGSQVAISGNMHRITIASIMQST